MTDCWIDIYCSYRLSLLYTIEPGYLKLHSDWTSVCKGVVVILTLPAVVNDINLVCNNYNHSDLLFSCELAPPVVQISTPDASLRFQSRSRSLFPFFCISVKSDLCENGEVKTVVANLMETGLTGNQFDKSRRSKKKINHEMFYY